MPELSSKLRARLVNITSTLNFDCQFRSDGSCARRRSSDAKWGDSGTHPIKNCCAGCLQARGYFGYADESGAYDKVSHLFNKETGFYRHGSGCIIPREQRSFVCLKHTCWVSPMQQDVSDVIFHRIIKPMHRMESK